MCGGLGFDRLGLGVLRVGSIVASEQGGQAAQAGKAWGEWTGQVAHDREGTC